MAKRGNGSSGSTASRGCDAKLWLAAAKLWNHPDPLGFVQSEKLVEAREERIGNVAVHGWESRATTRNLATMDLVVRGIEAEIGPEQADTFRRDHRLAVYLPLQMGRAAAPDRHRA